MNSSTLEWLTLLEQIPAPIIVFQGQDLTVVACTREQLAMWGRSRDQIVGSRAADTLSAERVGMLQQVFQTGQALHNKSVKISFQKDGKEHTGYYNYLYTPWVGASGNTLGVVAIIGDVTSAFREQERVELLTRNLLQLANAMPQLVWIATAQGVVTYYNDRLELFHGASRNEDGSWKWEGLLHPDDLTKTEKAWTNSLETGQPYESEHRIMMAEKDYRWHLSRALPQFDAQGQISQWFGTATDIHDLKVAEEDNRSKERKLRASENKFSKLAQSLPQMIWTSGEDGEADFFNQTWYAFTGASNDSSHRGAWLQYLHPQDIVVCQKYIAYAREQEVAVQLDVRVKGITGNYSWYNLVFTQLPDSQEGPVRLIATFTNIDQRKAMEDELKQLVRQRTAELERSNQDLTQFAHITSHDLKEPLRKMKSFGLRLADELGSSTSEKAALYLSKIQNSAVRLSSMVDGILTYSKVDSIQAPLEHIEMNDLIADTILDFELMAKEKGAIISAESLHALTGTRVLIRQLFYNLLNNALKFSRPYVCPEIVIASSIDNDNGIIRYSVRDNGIGFSQEYADRIFETFFRLNSKDAYEGTGLGLALCRKIALRHGGDIQAISQEDSGSTFLVTFPIK